MTGLRLVLAVIVAGLLLTTLASCPPNSDYKGGGVGGRLGDAVALAPR